MRWWWWRSEARVFGRWGTEHDDLVSCWISGDGKVGVIVSMTFMWMGTTMTRIIATQSSTILILRFIANASL